VTSSPSVSRRRGPRVAACSGLLAIGLLVPAGTAAAVPVPDGARGDRPPTREAAEVCGSMVRPAVVHEIGALTGPPVGTVRGPVYSCRYRVEGKGNVVFRVRDLGTKARARAHVDARLARDGVKEALPGLGQGGFAGVDGKTVVRKDEFVLTVDPTGLDVTPADREYLSFTLANVVMGCW
jgi:hypothetical protein